MNQVVKDYMESNGKGKGDIEEENKEMGEKKMPSDIFLSHFLNLMIPTHAGAERGEAQLKLKLKLKLTYLLVYSLDYLLAISCLLAY